jgi:hypothetical protein
MDWKWVIQGIEPWPVGVSHRVFGGKIMEPVENLNADLAAECLNGLIDGFGGGGYDGGDHCCGPCDKNDLVCGVGHAQQLPPVFDSVNNYFMAG